jgi:hypothetical protein
MKKWMGIFAALLFLATLFSAGESRDSYLFFSPKMTQSYLVLYTDAEKELIEKDLSVVRSVCFDKVKPAEKTPFFLTTAGGPGARKSTILERFVSSHPEYQSGVYVDPDQRGLKFMPHTYYAQSLSAKSIAESDQYSPAIRAAYEKWRGASNYITYQLMEEAFYKGMSVVHGSTSTAVHVNDFFSQLKNRGYDITLLLCSSTDQFRFDAVQYRNAEQRFYQSTPEDAFNKGKAFAERMSVYFTKADTLYVYWSDCLDKPEQLAAVFSKGALLLINQNALEKFVTKYEMDRETLLAEGKELPSWNELVETYQARF